MLSTLGHRLRLRGRAPRQGHGAQSLPAAACHLLWPWRCPLCGQGGFPEAHQAVCPACLRSIRTDLFSTYCVGCGRQLADDESGQERCGLCQTRPMAFESLAVAGRHKHALRQAIVQWKFNRCLGIEPLLADLLSEELARQPWRGGIDGFVPVPQPWTRWIRRGFFWPVRDLAIALSTHEGKPLWPALRARPHRPQVGLTSAQRIDNARHVFYVPVALDLSGKQICLVDDVTTTGSTLHNAAMALREAGADRVWAIVISKAGSAANS